MGKCLNTGRTHFKKGFTPWNKGLKTGLVPKTAIKKGQHLSQSTEFKKSHCLNKGISKPRGEKASNWQGGKTAKIKLLRNSVEFADWRTDVFVRDNYTCQKCGAKNGNGKRITLHPHHKIPVSVAPDKIFDVNNGETLCYDCHYSINHWEVIRKYEENIISISN